MLLYQYQYRKSKSKAYSKNDINQEKPYLRKILPYIIEFNKETKDFFLLDRDYLYMGCDNITTKASIELNLYKKSTSEYERIYLYNDECNPWDDKRYMCAYINKYITEKRKLNKCKNNVSTPLDYL